MNSDKLSAFAEDAILRVEAVNGKRVVRLLLSALASPNGHSKLKKTATRVEHIEGLLFGKSTVARNELQYEQVMLSMYRSYIGSGAKASKRISIEEAAVAAIREFHPEIFDQDIVRLECEQRKETLLKRYSDFFSKQRSELPTRFLELYEDGSEEIIVAEFLAHFLNAAGLAIDLAAIRDGVQACDDSVITAIETDLGLQLATPGK